MRLSGSRSAVLALVSALAVGLAAAAALALAPASYALNLRQPLRVTAGRAAPGLPAPAPTAQALAASVRSLSGLAPADVTTQALCTAPAPGHAACAAEALVRRTGHTPIHPRVHAGATFTQTFPRLRGGVRPSAAPGGAAAAPAAGTPAYLQQAYDLTYLSQTAGGGDTVAIVDAGGDPNAASDLATYRSAYGLPPCTSVNGCFSKVNEQGNATPLPPSAGADWESEESLDLDAVSALCPNCHILLVVANSSATSDLDAGVAAAQALGANQISASWTSVGSSPQGTAGFPGASVIAATGDHGYPGAGSDAYPAAYPAVTAAGGTTLSPASGGGSLRGWSEAAWSLNSSGTGWGGGSGCAGAQPKPAWQSDTGCAGRSYADVSADANPDTGLRIYDSGNGGWFVEGGTSLATPLIAAFEALTGVNGASAQWAYANSALLNDPSTGSTGSCAAAIGYICTAQPGYDGPTGAGSISGTIVTGGPGIGGPSTGDGSTNTYATAVGATTASLAGGVYPNGLATSYVWQYGPTTAYGQQTATAPAGAGAAPAAASAQLTGLTPGTTYHYRLVATNADGTAYGYDQTVTTSTITNAPPQSTAAPAVSGSPLQGQVLTAAPGAWSPVAGTLAYQWQRSTDGGASWTSITGATSSTYTVAGGDLGDEIDVVVTAGNAYGVGTATSAPAGPIASGAPAAGTAPSVAGHADQGQVLSAVSSWTPSATALAYRWQSSADGGVTWTDIAGATGPTYAPGAADLGAEIRAAITATNAYGTTTATTSPAGPVVNAAPVNTSAPAVAGIAQRTGVLSANAGAWSGTGLTYAFQWQRSPDGGTWTSIAGAVGTTYTLQAADEGGYIRVIVTAANADGVTSATSAATTLIAPDPPANTAPPVLSGTPQRGQTLTATQGTWTGAGNVYAYQWQRDTGEGFADITGATGSAYTLQTADEAATVRVVVSATNPDATISQASTPTAPVAAAAPVEQSAPTISGTTTRGQTLSAGVGAWSGVANAYAYQWQRSADGGATWTPLPGATGSQYLLGAADEGAALRVVVTASNADGTLAAASAPTPSIAAAPPAATAPPGLTGGAQRGQTLAATTGSWTGAGNAYALQWQRSAGGSTWTNIPGATGATYTLTTADENAVVRIAVTASNVDAAQSAVSAPSATVAATPPRNTTLPVLAGTAQRGDNLSVSAGAWNGIGNGYSCQWQRSADGSTWVNITGATAWSYGIAVADEGGELRAVITAVNPDGTATAATAATAAVSAAPVVNTSPPTIAGAALRGTALSSTLGGWSGTGNAYGYQWQRSADGGADWTDIPGATGFGYMLSVADEGDEVRLQITAANLDGSVTAASAATAVIAASRPLATAAPTVTGSPQRGLTLAAQPGSWNGIGTRLAYQWQRSADGGTTWTSIPGAAATQYVAAVADEGEELRVQVTGSNADGTAVAASAATAVVTATAPVATALPPVTGSAARGQTLTSTGGTWLGVGNAYADQWQRSGDGGATWSNISGATGVTYAVGVGDEGDELRLLVTATNADGSSSAPSAPTVTVPAAPPVNTAAPAVTGTAARGNLLTAAPGSWNGIGNLLSYQWQHSTDGSAWSDIADATQATYPLTVADEGTFVRVQVTAANPDGTQTAASAATGRVTGAPPASSVAPAISGLTQRGDTLGSTPGVWSGSGNTLAYQWQRSADGGTSWGDVTGATRSTYTLQAADEGAVVRLVVTATNPDGTASATSPASVTVLASPPVNAGAPVIFGLAQRTAILTATSGAWTGAGDTLAYQWQRSGDGGISWTNIAGATASAYTLTTADEHDVVRMLVTATNPDGSVSAASTASAAVQGAAPMDTVAPSIGGAPRLGAQMTANPGTWSPNDATFTYTWQRGDPVDGYTTIAGATGGSYRPVAADAGGSLRVIVTATNADGSTTATSTPTPTIVQAPVNLIAPAAPAGTLVAGNALTPDTGMWDSPATYTYAWLRCPGGATIVNAACGQVAGGPTYTLAAADVGSEIAVTVTATSAGGATVVTSALTGTVAGQPLINRVPPSIGGSPQVPGTLTANPGTWSVAPTSIAYTWKRCAPDGVTGCTTAAAADTAHYTLSPADTGHAIVLVAQAASPGQTSTAQSPPLVVQSQPLPQATVLPSMSGAAVRTAVLTAAPGAWANSPTTVSYQWERCDASGRGCQPIAGATQTTYQLAAADEGGTVTVAVTAANAAGAATAAAAPSGVVAGLAPAVSHPPALSTAAVQQGVPVGVGGAAWQTTAGTTYATSWERCGATGAGCQAIPGATAAQYVPVAADVGHTLVGVITATNVDGAVPSASPASPVVLPAAPRWRDLPVLTADSGDVGGTVSVTPGVWSGPAVASDTVALMRCTSTCAPVAFSGGRYTIASADTGALLRVRETASNAGGSTAVWSAQYVGPVASAASASAVLGGGQAVLRNDHGAALAVAALGAGAVMSSDALIHARRAPAPAARAVIVRRARGVHGRLRMWVCAAARAAAPATCTRTRAFGGTARIILPPALSGRVRVVVVRR